MSAGRLLICVAAAATAFLAAPARACEIVGGPVLSPGKRAAVANSPFDASDPDAHLWALITVNGEEAAVPAWADGADSFDFIAPAFYQTPWDDTPVESFWLTDGEVGCEISGLTKTGLQRRNGILQAFILTLFEKAKADAANLGADQAAIDQVSGGGSVLPDDGPLLEAIANTRTLFLDVQQLRQDASADPELAEQLAVIDSYLAASDYFEPAMQRAQSAIDLAQTAAEADAEAGDDGFAPLLWPAPADGSRVGFTPIGFTQIQATPAQPRQAAPKPVIEIDGQRLVMENTPRTAAELSAMMQRQMDASIYNGPVAGFYRDSAGTILGIGSALPRYGKVFEGFSHAVFLDTIRDKITEGLYPGQLVSLNVEGGPTVLRIDRDPYAGAFTGLKVVTRAKGLNVAQLTADIALNFASPFGKYTGAAGRAISGRAGKLAARLPGKTTSSVPAEKLKLVSDAAKDAMKSVFLRSAGPSQGVVTNVENALRDTVKAVAENTLKQALGMRNSNADWGKIAVIPPFEFPPVDIMEPGYFTDSPNTLQYLNYERGERRIDYSSKNRGVTIVTFQTQGGKFGAEQLMKEVMISVGERRLEVTPTDKVVTPGEQFAYYATVRGANPQEANDGEVAVMTTPGLTLDSPVTIELSENSEALVRTSFIATAPRSMDDYPAAATFSLETDPAVYETRLLKLPAIAPSGLSCIPHGETVQFEAPDETGAPVAGLTWSAEGPGTISARGAYVAPDDGEGEVIIRVSGANSGVVFDEKTLSVGCSCRWNYRIAGMEASGEYPSLTDFGSGAIATYVFIMADGGLGITGHGSATSPRSTGVTIEHEGQSFAVGDELDLTVQDQCPHSRIDYDERYMIGGRWLTVAIGGDAYRIDSTLGACPTIAPFSASVTIDLGGESAERLDQITGEIASGDRQVGGDASDLFAAIASQGMNMSACLGN